MTQKLEMLKGVLQRVMGESVEGDFYKEGLSDGIYACQFDTSTALEEWILIWGGTASECMTETEVEYQQGVQFVADEWDKILSEDNL